MTIIINLVSFHTKVLHFLQNTPIFANYLGEEYGLAKLVFIYV